MPIITGRNRHLGDYQHRARENTMLKGQYRSKCLCHGSAGNLLCLASTWSEEGCFQSQFARLDSELVTDGFESLGAAQTMSIGLMTGLSGAGYYLLGRASKSIDNGILTLA